MKVAFLHPDLGLGGAERLIVDAAVELETRGHRTAIFTARHDPERAFPETRSLDVRVHGGFIPSRIRGRLQAPLTIARMTWASGALAAGRWDAVICDLVSYPIPLLKLLQRAPVLYYCHYPDQLLAPPRSGAYRFYRAPLDWLEVPAMRAADRVVTNSRYTAGVLAGLGCPSEVLYPGVDVERYAGIGPAPLTPGGDASLLVISRFDERKNLPLAVEAMAALRELAPETFARTQLHLAGGLDPARREDHEIAGGVEARARALGLAGKVTLHKNPSEAERLALLAGARAVVHTALGEHFGLVPVEAMAAGRPVVCVADAGPLETVVDGETGYLCAPEPKAFAAAIARLAGDAELAARLGQAGRERARRLFSRRAFGDALEALLVRMCQT